MFRGVFSCTASSLRAMCAYVGGEDSVLQAGKDFIERVESAVGDRYGSSPTSVTFDQRETAKECSDIAGQIGVCMQSMCHTGMGIAVDFRVMLLYIDPEGGPRIAYDDSSLADKLVESVLAAVGDAQGRDPVSIDFGNDEDLARQFRGVASNIKDIMDEIADQ